MVVYAGLLHDQISAQCIICELPQPLAGLTPGSLYADKTQAFACTAHLYDREQWIIAWAVFDVEQDLHNSWQEL
ncbi:MAG TPA: hypothetical protein VF733_03545 [Candidatus Saccharimonadales bacterium]